MLGSVASGKRQQHVAAVRPGSVKNMPVKARMTGSKSVLRVRPPKKRTESHASSLIAPSAVRARAVHAASNFSVSKSLIFVGVVFGLLLCKLFIRLEIMDMSYKIENARNELVSNDALFRELKAKRAIEANPRKISEDARKKLNLRPTTPQQIRRVNR